MSQYLNQAAAEDVSSILTTRVRIFLPDLRCTVDLGSVKYMWKGKKTLLIYLFFFNRYVIPLSFIVNLVAYTLQSWDEDSCERYVRYEGVMTAVGIESAGLMMLIRVYAMYNGNDTRWIPKGVAFILFVETVMNVYLLVHAGPCSMIFNGSHFAASASAWLPLLYETIVFKLTLFKTLQNLKKGGRAHLMHRMFQDGLVYYAVICAVNLTLIVMITSAPVGIQNVTAQLELLSHYAVLKSHFSLTIGMMSRITLSLREREHKPIGAFEGTDDYEPDYDEDDEEEYARIRWQTSSFSSARSRGKRPDTQFLSLSALGTIDSEPVPGIPKPEGEGVYFPSDFHAAELREILELRGLDHAHTRDGFNPFALQPCDQPPPQYRPHAAFSSGMAGHKGASSRSSGLRDTPNKTRVKKPGEPRRHVQRDPRETRGV
ncbi:hypothetical protein FIBSPDRAFT_899182 [Athelia psychrophila]|uniref:Uncharacterized protein n=1 Tax=Athelia psychrophila TaxID=1759441 RepID=A0A166A2B0_9AGAM|nr:hypothetical protein FIBSPDRAFT_899182 [Fibularhizoctonia sp. CBS 109695]